MGYIFYIFMLFFNDLKKYRALNAENYPITKMLGDRQILYLLKMKVKIKIQN